MLKGKKILLLVTGSIAAYKSAYLVRLLVKAGAEVRVVMSKGALEFVTPLTFSALSNNPVHSEFTEDKNQGTWTNHVNEALWADLMVAAPLSANTLSKMASGQCDSYLMAVYMSARCPVMLAPAMDHDMYQHHGTQQNIVKLKNTGSFIIEPKEGQLASGISGQGRMAEPEEIFESIITHFNPMLPLLGKKVMVTAGPTFEQIDPVRFIGNFSSGKMGYEVAESLANAGALVSLISGPVSLHTNHPRITRLNVKSAAEMLNECVEAFDGCNAAVMVAAVADYRPAMIATQKVKKNKDGLTLILENTEDIAATLGKAKKAGQVLVGFALETENAEVNAVQKLERKNLDMIVLNSLRDEGVAFGADTSKVTIFWPGNKKKTLELMTKKQLAENITNEIVTLISR
ncbi:MAG: bifunctional phosphopantothenoylcysteine decarboxylase/phosphopantothenate--cysteine ligase CoaBC [Flavobacteriales bacterium]